MERVVRNFKLVEQIGTGGMGVIYKALQTTLDRTVAFKELHPHLAKDPDFIRRFEREAKTAAGLQHENIVGVIDFGQDGESYFIAMEFVAGVDLKQLMSKDPKVALPVTLTVMVDVLRGLEHAHANGVIHRDIKPANVMVTREGVSKIADFSIAQAATLPSMTVTGAMLGTPAYMSPEQAGGGRALDGRTDLFSCGVILYEMLAGRRPFEGDTYASVISRLLTVNPPDLTEVDRTVPVSITRVVRKALEKDPERRYKTAGELRAELEAAAAMEKIPLGRTLVADWAKAPKEFLETLRRRQAQEAYQRGLYLMNQGLSHLDEAIASLEAAVAWDPANQDAVRQLETLRLRKGPARRPLLQVGLLGAASLGTVVVGGALLWASGFFAPTPTPTPVAPLPTTVAVASAVPARSVPPSATPVAVPSHHASASVVRTPLPPPATLARAPTPTPSTVVAIPTLTPTPAPSATVLAGLVDPERKEGFLKVMVKPWAKVYVDGVYVADTPIASPIKLKTGSHELKLVNDAFQEYVERVDIPSGTIVSRQIALQPRR